MLRYVARKHRAASKCSANLLPHTSGTKLTRRPRQYICMYFQHRHPGIPCTLSRFFSPSFLIVWGEKKITSQCRFIVLLLRYFI